MGQAATLRLIENSKYEALNPKQARITKNLNSKRDCRVGLRPPRNDSKSWIPAFPIPKAQVGQVAGMTKTPCVYGGKADSLFGVKFKEKCCGKRI